MEKSEETDESDDQPLPPRELLSKKFQLLTLQNGFVCRSGGIDEDLVELDGALAY